MNLLVVVLVGLGAGLGSVLRVAISAPFNQPEAMAWGILVVNTGGSFLIGLYAALTVSGHGMLAATPVRHFVMAGLCGGFTTFSIFSLETLALFEAGRPGLAGIYASLSLVAWLIAVWVGFTAVRTIGPMPGKDQGK